MFTNLPCTMKKLFLRFTVLVCCTIFNLSLTAAAADDWQLLGRTEVATSPYDLYFYKLLQVNGSADRYASMIEVSVQADPNSFYVQGTYRIRVDKYSLTPDRFDGLEIQCTSGNPNAATFYIYNNAVWIRSNYKWGNIYYRTEGLFTGASPLNPTSPFGQTINIPTGYLYGLTTGAIKYDFDNNTYRLLPVADVNGNQSFYKDVAMVNGSKLGIGMSDQFAYDGRQQPHYGFQWTSDSWTPSGPTYWLSSYGGMKFFTSGSVKMVLTGEGNVGIGTVNPQGYKLAVNGDAIFTRVKVKSFVAWPDYVFSKDYQLPSLQEVENYIKAKRHLPGIPAAAEIAKEGMDVAEMNKQLLQKVEELTLYLIEQQKMINSLQAQDSLLKAEVEALKRSRH